MGQQYTRGNLTDKIDRNLLHEYLWKNRGRNDILPFTLGELADRLGITISTMSIIFRELREADKVRRVRGQRYKIRDPLLSGWENVPDLDGRLF